MKSNHLGSRYHCLKCDRSFGTPLGLRKHTKFHSLNRSLKTSQLGELQEGGMKVACNECKFVAINTMLLNQHKRSVHSYLIYSCELCESTFTETTDLRIHSKMHGVHTFPCNQCEFVSNDRPTLRKHIKIIHNSKCSLKNDDMTPDVLVLDISPAVKTEEIDAESLDTEPNSPNATPTKVLICSLCDFSARSRNALRYHEDKAHFDIRYPCSLYDYEGNGKSALKYHRDTKHKGLKYPCVYCGYIGNSRPALKYHTLTKHLSVR